MCLQDVLSPLLSALHFPPASVCRGKRIRVGAGVGPSENCDVKPAAVEDRWWHNMDAVQKDTELLPQCCFTVDTVTHIAGLVGHHQLSQVPVASQTF